MPFMLAPLVLAAAGLIALACSGNGAEDSPAAPAGSDAVAFETLLQRSIPGQGGGTIREAARDPESWLALWNRLREGGGEGFLPAEPPEVDFSRDMVVAVAMETQGCISKVTVRRILQGRGGLVVDLLEAPPAPNCVCITSERPLHVVRLPRSEEPVRFEVTQGVTNCGD